MNKLRQSLRDATRPSHERVDALFSGLDLKDPHDYAHFLRANRAAMLALSAMIDGAGSARADNPLRNHIAGCVDLLSSDLRALDDEGPSEPVQADAGETDPISGSPLGVQYVLAGAAFGKQILLQRWAKSDDTRVKSAGNYLKSDHNKRLWDDFQKISASLKPDQREIADMVRAADGVFDLFARSFHDTAKAR